MKVQEPTTQNGFREKPPFDPRVRRIKSGKILSWVTSFPGTGDFGLFSNSFDRYIEKELRKSEKLVQEWRN